MGGYYLGAGGGDANGIARRDGANWSALNLARWNGHEWSNLGGGFDGPVYALAVSGSTLCDGGRPSLGVCGPSGRLAAGARHRDNVIGTIELGLRNACRLVLPVGWLIEPEWSPAIGEPFTPPRP